MNEMSLLTRLREAKSKLEQYQMSCVETVAAWGNDGGYNIVIREQRKKIAELESEGREILKGLAEQLGVFADVEEN